MHQTDNVTLEFAGGGQDYVDATSMMLQFSSTSSKSCVNITIVNDNLYENTESFRVALNTSDPDAVLTPDEATVIIDDNNSESIQCVYGTYTCTLCVLQISGLAGLNRLLLSERMLVVGMSAFISLVEGDRVMLSLMLVSEHRKGLQEVRQVQKCIVLRGLLF